MLCSRWDPSVLSKGRALRVLRWWEAQGQVPRAQKTEEEVRHVGAQGHALRLALAPSLCPTNSPSHEKVEKRKEKQTAVLAHQPWAEPCGQAATRCLGTSSSTCDPRGPAAGRPSRPPRQDGLAQRTWAHGGAPLTDTAQQCPPHPHQVQSSL